MSRFVQVPVASILVSENDFEGISEDRLDYVKTTLQEMGIDPSESVILTEAMKFSVDEPDEYVLIGDAAVVYQAAVELGIDKIWATVFTMEEASSLIERDLRKKPWQKARDQKELCQCGHPYHRHFDSYDNMAPVGCKYCSCPQFVAPDRQE